MHLKLRSKTVQTRADEPQENPLEFSGKLGCKNRIKIAVGLGILSIIQGCTSESPKMFQSELQRQRQSFIARASSGMVVADHHLASQAGADMLIQGGNAVDAAVAASFVLSVVRPQSTGIGGGGFLLYYNNKDSETSVFDFRERAPVKASKNMFIDPNTGNALDYFYKGVRIPNASINGHMSVGVPGLVAGLLEVHTHHGTLPLKKIIKPAIKIAREGFQVYPSLAKAIMDRQLVLRNFPGSRKLFLPKGRPLSVGEKLIQEDLATTLELISQHGKRGFYHGRTLDLLLAELELGGIVTRDDFEQYKVKVLKPVIGHYKDHKIVSMPPPSSGGVHIIQILNMVSAYPFASWSMNSPARIHHLAEAMRRAYVDRAKYLGDPEFSDVPTKGLISMKYARNLQATINSRKATPSRELAAGNPFPYESPETTHISVVDKEGNAVSSTQTINFSFGSGVVAQGTGVVLNDEMDDFSIKPDSPNAYGLLGSEANSVAAKKTMLSSMSPTLVFDKNKKLRMVVGSPGGSMIITATLQTILNSIDYNLPLEDAVHSYRIHHQWFPDELRIEKDGVTPQTVRKLAALGHNVREFEGAIGKVQAIAWEKGGWVGVSDTRSDGVPVGFNQEEVARN